VVVVVVVFSYNWRPARRREYLVPKRLHVRMAHGFPVALGLRKMRVLVRLTLRADMRKRTEDLDGPLPSQNVRWR